MSHGVVKAAGLGAVVLSVWAVLAAAAFRHPHIDPPAETDAYYVLASPGGVAALEAVDEWLPPGKTLLVSATPGQMTLPLYQRACADQTRPVICVDPIPATTQGEAQNLGKVSQEQGWRSVTVVTHRSHITRSRILMQRCFDGELRMSVRNVEHGKRAWLRALLYESGAMIKTWATPRCDGSIPPSNEGHASVRFLPQGAHLVL